MNPVFEIKVNSVEVVMGAGCRGGRTVGGGGGEEPPPPPPHPYRTTPETKRSKALVDVLPAKFNELLHNQKSD